MVSPLSGHKDDDIGSLLSFLTYLETEGLSELLPCIEYQLDELGEVRALHRRRIKHIETWWKEKNDHKTL